MLSLILISDAKQKAVRIYNSGFLGLCENSERKDLQKVSLSV